MARRSAVTRSTLAYSARGATNARDRTARNAEILALHGEGLTGAAIAEKLGVSTATVSRAINGGVIKNPRPALPLDERFWANVQRGGADECWPWTAGTGAQGYGAVTIDGHSRRAHRVAWLLTYGYLPDGMMVLHRCDNPPCCNPEHLFLGDHDLNMQDKARKGRALSAA